jgi:hypothetical protein
MRTPIFALAALSLAIASPAMAQMAIDKPANTTTETSGITTLQGPGGRSITAFDRSTQTRVGGYYDIEFKQPLNGGNSFFDQHRLILQVSSYLHENLMFNTEIEYEHGGAINALDNKGELKIEQAWADYKVNDALNFRSGIVLIPFGYVNVLHDSDVRDTTTRPLMASTIIPTTWMDAGTGVHGILYPTEDMMLSYEAYVTNGLTDNISAARGIRNARPGLSSDNNGNKALSGRVGISPWLGWELGLNGYTSQYDAASSRRLTMLGVDNSLTLGSFELVGEYAKIQTAGGTYTAPTGTPPATNAIPGSMQGWYLEARQHFFPEFLNNTFLGRAGGYDQATFTLVGRFGQADTDQATYNATDKNETVVGLNYRPIPTFVTKLEWQRINEPATGKIDDALWSSVAVGF